MSNPTVVEYCACNVPVAVWDDETNQNICSACGGVINATERVIVNLSMLKISDKVLELAELQSYQATLLKDLTKLMADWSAALTKELDE